MKSFTFTKRKKSMRKMLMTFPGAEIYQIQKDGIVSLPYNETEHYKMTVRFMRNPESALEAILGEKED